MANVLPIHKQVQIIAALVEGCSIRGTERMTGSHRDTIMRLGVRVGEACGRLHDVRMRNLNVSLIQADELWAFVGKKQKRVTAEDGPELGDAYTFLAMDSVKKAIISFRTGKRDAANARALADDLRMRILNAPQLTTDGFRPYIDAIERSFGAGINYSMVIKKFQGDPDQSDPSRRYSPGRVTSITKKIISGEPVESSITTSHIERQNLTVRMQTRRFTRLTNAFSKKLKNHRAAVALYVAWYNFCRVHESLRVTPAMEVGVSDHPWTIEELIVQSLAMPESGPAAAPGAPPTAPREPEGMSAAQAKRFKKRPGHGAHVPWLRLIDGGRAA